MARAYYRELLMRVRERLPDAALGSDIIVGFPGETDEAFDRSLEFFARFAADLFPCLSLFFAARNDCGLFAGSRRWSSEEGAGPQECVN